MSTEIHYKFNDETFMGTDPFQDLWDKTHKVPKKITPAYDVEDYDECVEDLDFDDLDLD
jgi:hypothetical protein